jgi:hypothetical protein
MARIDIEDIVERRLEIIQTETPGAITKYDLEEAGDLEWGVITVSDEDGRTQYVEFIESRESLARSDALDQYNEAAQSCGRVLVIVPDRAKDMAADILFRGSNPSIELVSYGVIGISILA